MITYEGRITLCKQYLKIEFLSYRKHTAFPLQRPIGCYFLGH
jgi:hypothetical protein